MADPKKIDLQDNPEPVAEASARAKPIIAINPDREVIVDGEMSWSPMVLAAKRIVFKPGSRLIFDNTDAHAAGHFHIVADEIVAADPANPGVITWYSEVPKKPVDRGQASSGALGAGEGANGGNGAEGAPGVTGSTGPSAPDLTLYVRTIGNGGCIVDFNGGTGGEGGQGQKGGTGGPGAQGSHARQGRQSGPFNTTIWLPYCDAGPGRGGNGGSGGTGGPGGTGGAGGSGGNVTLVSLPEHLPTLSEVVRVETGGGSGGAAGNGGAGGEGGAGGPEGALANFCNSQNRVGSTGSLGNSGAQGQRGESGRPGQVYVAELSNSAFQALFGFQ